MYIRCLLHFSGASVPYATPNPVAKVSEWDSRDSTPCARHTRSTQPLCFHILTNPSSRKPLCFTFIQNPRGVTPPMFLQRLGHLASRTFVANPIFSAACRLFVSLGSLSRIRSLCFQTFAASFSKTPGVGYTRTKRPLWDPTFPFPKSRVLNLRQGIAYHE
jgi:hypothetical protein